MRTITRSGMLLSLVVIISLAAAALTPAAVFAEGDIPEAPPPEPQLAEEDPIEEDIHSAVEALAENGAVIVDPDGAPVPLVSQTALDVLCDPDPWFYGTVCPGGKCLGYLTIQAALNSWVTMKGKGFIYVEGGYIQAENLSIDGDVYPTLRGIVWDTSNGLAMPVNNARLQVYDFKTGFTIQGLKIVVTATGGNALNIINNTGLIKLVDVDVVTNYETGDGIYIRNTGPVELLRVDSSGNKGLGAWISNCTLASGLCPSTGYVKVTNSSFNQNGLAAGLDINDRGLWIQSGGAITLNAVTAHGNEGDGLYLGAFGPVVIKNSTFAKSIQYDATNGGNGIRTHAESTGAILLDNVLLYGNQQNGAFLQTTNNITLKRITASENLGTGVRITNGYTSDPAGKNIFLSDSTFYNNNRPLWIEATGSITLTNVSAFSSSGSLYVSNRLASIPSSVNIKNVTIKSILDHGLYVLSKGNIILNGITVEFTFGNNAYLSNDPAAIAGATGSVSVLSSLGINRFNNGILTYSGLEIHTGKNVVLSKVKADNNNGGGILIRAYGDISNVTMTDVTASGNEGFGVDVQATGAITWTRGGANGNGLSTASTGGATLSNNSSCVTRNIVLRDVTFNNNLNGSGLVVKSKGSVTITNLAADDNARGGVVIDNIYGLNGKVTITRSLATGFNTIERNRAGSVPGLTINSKGAVYINRLSASFTEDGHGAYIDNCRYNGAWCDVPVLAPVTVLNSVFNANDPYGAYSGIVLTASGAVTLTSVTASNNGHLGAVIQNKNAAPPTILAYNRPVRVTKGIFQRNTGSDGLSIQSDRAVYLNSITSSYNGRHGVMVINNATSLPSLVSVTGKNLFSGNTEHGLYIVSVGNVVVSGSTATDNDLRGIYIDTEGTVTMSNISAMGNVYHGVYIFGKVKILLTNLNVFTNGITTVMSGIFIYGDYSDLSPKIYIYNSTLIGNGEYGLRINAQEPNSTYVFIYNTNLFGNLIGEKIIN